MRFVLSVLLVGLMAVGFAQTPPAAGVVSGVVVDAAGAGVPGALVELRADAGISRRATSDAGGAFTFENVPHGTYQLRATSPTLGAASVRLTVGSTPTTSQRLVLTGLLARSESRTSGTDPAANQAPRQTAELSQDHSRLMAPSAMQALGGIAPAAPVAAWNREAYSKIDENGFHRVTDDPLSTFSIDVDTASYANVRRFLNDGALPPLDAVRVEELINYFRFDYATPTGTRPFAVTTDVGPAPWAPSHRLVLIGLKARPMDETRTPPRNLVFLLDVSGSMASPDKLPLVKTAMRMLTATLTPADRVAIVVYAGASGTALPSTSGADRARIEQAIEDLKPGGSTNGAAGIQLAYDLAAQSFIKGGINRVILASDGDFNVGMTSQGDLLRLIEEKRERGVFLSVLGVGTGNLNDSTMEQLANRGNGNYSYLDSLHEARRVLVAEAGGTLVTVAKDVKIQVEFNPARVGAYRLIGYENRLLAHRDFNDDRKDAGEIGAGHTVTALYELVPPGEAIPVSGVDPLKYQAAPRPASAADSDELLTVKLRYKEPAGDTSQLMSVGVPDRSRSLSPNLGFAAAVAEFGMLLRRSEHVGQATWSEARDLARRHRGEDPDGYRAEFIRLVELAAALDAQQPPSTRRGE
jgi:Ca-activated chloride channel family protein